jgi:hypothetical protein
MAFDQGSAAAREAFPSPVKRNEIMTISRKVINRRPLLA